jgi:hypothetical protein
MVEPLSPASPASPADQQIISSPKAYSKSSTQEAPIMRNKYSNMVDQEPPYRSKYSANILKSVMKNGRGLNLHKVEIGL